MQLPEQTRLRLFGFVATGLCAGLCLLYARYRTELWPWWRGYGGGIPYVAFWACFFFMLMPRREWMAKLCIAATLMTCGLEVLQLWNPEPLASFRLTKFGAALLGSTFMWDDFPPYFLGGLFGYIVLKGTLTIFDRVFPTTA